MDAILAVSLVLYTLSFLSAENLRGGAINESIYLDGTTFSSRKAFFQTGARCRTADLSAEESRVREVEMHALPLEIIESEAANVVQMVRVFFHIITATNGMGTVSQKRIDKQMEVLNKAYEGSIIQFTLANVRVIADDSWFTTKLGTGIEVNMKQALRRGSYKDLNIYTTRQTDSTLGWATFPGRVGPDYRMDGVVVDHRSLPGGKDFAPYNLGQTATHESGHWFGLQHPFNGGCASDPWAGDLIIDTPAEAFPNFGCPEYRNSCPHLPGDDPIHNYMDFSDDHCMNSFTAFQKQRIKKQWLLYRA